MGAKITVPPNPTRIKTGIYTGDGNATKAITGIGFRPAGVFVFPLANYSVTDSRPTVKTTETGLYAYIIGAFLYVIDVIISLDADGFTLGDGTGSLNYCNVVGINYVFIAFRTDF